MTNFDNLMVDSTIEAETDSVGTSGPMDTDLYKGVISMAYTDKSKGGATGFHVHVEMEGGREFRQAIYITSGTAKGCKNYYERDGKKFLLPGFVVAEGICLLAAGKPLAQVFTDSLETKVIKLYDYDAKKEVPTEKEVIGDLIGKQISLGIMQIIEDKTSLGDDGKYHPTGETRTINEIDKVFRASDGFTVAEIKAQAAEATFANTWKAKFAGTVRDKSTKDVKAKSGMPAAAAGGAAKPATSLFAQ